MAKKKYYAVRKGVKTGVFDTWEECKNCVNGYSGAEYKSFSTMEEAQDFINGAKETIFSDEQDTERNVRANNETEKNIATDKNTETEKNIATDKNTETDKKYIEIYVDGSYRKDTNEFSYGMVVLDRAGEYCFSEKFSDEELASMNNVAGEIKGAEAAMRYALNNEIADIRIYHDYEGIAKWCTGAWKANKPGTIKYRNFYNSITDKVNVEFVKVKGHSNDKYNDMADKLAKEALGI